MRHEPDWTSGEPPIEDVLDEPIIRLLMRRDNVTPGALRQCILDARRHLARHPQASGGPMPEGIRWRHAPGQGRRGRRPAARERVPHDAGDPMTGTPRDTRPGQLRP